MVIISTGRSNMSHSCRGKYFKFYDRVDVNKCLKQIKLPFSLFAVNVVFSSLVVFVLGFLSVCLPACLLTYLPLCLFVGMSFFRSFTDSPSKLRAILYKTVQNCTKLYKTLCNTVQDCTKLYCGNRNSAKLGLVLLFYLLFR